MKYKLILFFLVTTLSFSITGCGNKNSVNETETTTETEETTRELTESTYEKGTPEYITDSFLKAYKSEHFDIMKSYMVDEVCSFDTESMNSSVIAKNTVDIITDEFTYKIKNCDIKNKDATVEVEMENIWMSKIMMDTTDEWNKTAPVKTEKTEVTTANEKSENELSEDEKDFLEIMDKYTKEYKNKEKYKGIVKISLTKEENGWKIINDNEVFDYMSGEYISFTTKYLPHFSNNSQIYK